MKVCALSALCALCVEVCALSALCVKVCALSALCASVRDKSAKRFAQDDGFVGYRRAWRRRRALVITETELKLMAAAAIIGLSSSPKTG